MYSICKQINLPLSRVFNDFTVKLKKKEGKKKPDHVLLANFCSC